MADEREYAKKDIYHLRVKGSLDEKWADWFEGFVMSSRDNGEMLLTGAVADQAALHGVLGKIHGLGLPLLLVAKTDSPCSNKSCPRRGHCRDCVAYHAVKGQESYCFRTKTKWDKQCAVFVKARGKRNGEIEMSSNGKKTSHCGDCALRKRAESNPKSLIGRFWFWHIKWCPGWKAYQEQLARQEG